MIWQIWKTSLTLTAHPCPHAPALPRPQVLQRLVPAVIGTLKSPHDAARKKVPAVAHVTRA